MGLTCRSVRIIVVVLMSLVTITSCAANIKDTARLDRDDGVLVATIKTNFRGRISLINQQNLMLSSAVFWVEPGLNFKIIELPAGKYRWRGILPGLSSSQCAFTKHEEFEITSNTINYVGDPEIIIEGRICRWIFHDHGAETKQYLQKRYPKLSRSRAFSSRLTYGTARRRMPLSVLEDDEPKPLPTNPRAVIAKVLVDTAGFRDQLCACED
jgi:hypothetical protein